MKTIAIKVPDEKVKNLLSYAETNQLQVLLEVGDDLIIPEWQKELVRERIKNSDKSKRLTLAEVKVRLKTQNV